MSLIVEDGSGVVAAASYVAVVTADAYYTARPQLALSVTWAAATDANKEGALREASAFCDAVYGEFYIGRRMGYVQGLLWPRTDALDAGGYELPAVPPELVSAVCELAGRAVSSPLAVDVDRGGEIKRISKALGPLKKDIEYFEAASLHKSYGFVSGMLATIMNGSQPGATGSSWNWK